MKIDWFYLNSLAEAKVIVMNDIFQDSKFNQNLGTWDFSKYDINKVFLNAKYTPDNYLNDRKEYLNKNKTKDNTNNIDNTDNSMYQLNIIEFEF